MSTAISRGLLWTLFGKTNLESSGSLDSNELDIEGFKATQRNELVFPGQYTTGAYTSDLGVSEVLCSLFWKHVCSL